MHWAWIHGRRLPRPAERNREELPIADDCLASPAWVAFAVSSARGPLPRQRQPGVSLGWRPLGRVNVICHQEASGIP